ncbi:MAG: PAS domain-containing protein [candidate division WOR-3 bacterium]|nr:PAS domain-containing protein [candidate division WOR-3 bacterium]
MAKIFVISQDLGLIDIISESLKNDGHGVSTCSKPSDVLSLVQNKDYDLVFIDVHIHDEPHEKVVDVVRNFSPESEVVLITSYAFPYISGQETDAVMSYLVQPLTEEKVKNVAKRALRQARISRERRHLLSNITAAKKQWEATVDAIDDPIFLIDLDYNVMRANLMTYRRLGKGVDNVLGGKCYQIFHCSDSAPSDCPGRRAMLTGKMASDVIHFKGLDERLACDVYPQVFAGGGFVHHLHAPTLSYETQSELMTTYERVFDESLVPILLIDVDDYKIVDANRRALQFFARDPGMIFNVAIGGLFVSTLSERAINSLIEILRNRGGSFKSRVVDGTGNDIEVVVIANTVNIRNRRLAAIFMIPVELL